MPIAQHAARPSRSREERWPHLPLDEWAATRDRLHMWTQISGKLKVELAPFQNQLWHTALYLNARGLTTGAIPNTDGIFAAEFDFIDHSFSLTTSEGGHKVIPLYPRSVAHFYDETLGCLEALGIHVQFDPVPQEIPGPIPFDKDTTHNSYDPHAANRWWRILVSSARVMEEHRSRFRGKASPIHWFWGSFDLAATRHSGKPAEPPPGGYTYRVAEDEENWAGGLWPGSGPVDYPAFYAYVYPQPDGYPEAAIEPDATFWSTEMRESLLTYDAVRTADDPEAALMAFLQSTYAAGAELAGWGRARLEFHEIPRPRRFGTNDKRVSRKSPVLQHHPGLGT